MNPTTEREQEKVEKEKKLAFIDFLFCARPQARYFTNKISFNTLVHYELYTLSSIYK